MPLKEALKWFALPSAIGVVLLLGAVIIDLGHDEWGWTYPVWLRLIVFLVGELGVAIIIATLLGIVFESFLRQRALQDIVRASVGYLLPKSIRGEMAWLSNLSLIRTNYEHRFTLQPYDEGSVTVKECQEYDIENVSAAKQPYSLHVSIDEFHHKTKKSEIICVGYRRGSLKKEFCGSDLKDRVRDDGWALTFDYKLDDLAPGEKVSVWSEFTQTKQRSDQIGTVLIQATENPRILVEVPDDLSYAIGVQHRENLIQMMQHNYRLIGTVLPYQSISLRWWPKIFEKVVGGKKAGTNP